MPVFVQYNKQFQTNPDYITFGFAAYIYFMKAVKKDGDKYYGILNGNYYLIQDPKAAYFYQKWQVVSLPEMVHTILKDPFIWGKDLTKAGVIEESVVLYLESIKTHGALAALKAFLGNMEYA